MQPSTDPVIQPEWHLSTDPPPADATRWLTRLQRFSLVRAHISLFAAGSVILLTLNLLAGSARVWADRWITAWALVIIIHAIAAGIATLALQLMEEDDVRPASEVHWEPAPTSPEPVPAWPQPAPVTEAPAPASAPAPDPWHSPPPPPRDDERVSWQAASDAAWLAASDRPADTADPAPEHPAPDGVR